jgi:hypothetical protein
VNLPSALPGGGVGYKPTPIAKGSHPVVAKQAAGGTNAIKTLQEMRAAAAMSGPWTGEKLKRYKQAQTNYVIGYAGLKGQGQVTPDDQKMYLGAVPDAPTEGIGYMSDAQLAQIDSQIGVISQETNDLGSVYGPPSAAGKAPPTSLAKPVK